MSCILEATLLYAGYRQCGLNTLLESNDCSQLLVTAARDS